MIWSLFKLMYGEEEDLFYFSLYTVQVLYSMFPMFPSYENFVDHFFFYTTYCVKIFQV